MYCHAGGGGVGSIVNNLAAQGTRNPTKIAKFLQFLRFLGDLSIHPTSGRGGWI